MFELFKKLILDKNFNLLLTVDKNNRYTILLEYVEEYLNVSLTTTKIDFESIKLEEVFQEIEKFVQASD